MKLIVVTGSSGSGKSSALDMLEDLGYYCIDNLPAALLAQLAKMQVDHPNVYPQLAVSIDARSTADLDIAADALRALQGSLEIGVAYFRAKDEVLIRRFSETRRRHPLSNDTVSLVEAIAQERRMLAPLAEVANWFIDTSDLSVHDLRSTIRAHLATTSQQMTVLVKSFSYKHELPQELDLVFDMRLLPNPYWEQSLREFDGRDDAIKAFFAEHDIVTQKLDDVTALLRNWLPGYDAVGRSYVSVGFGCTGGQHRSVYSAEQIGQRFADEYSVIVRHNELEKNQALLT